MSKPASKIFKCIVPVIGIILFCTCFAFIKADIVGSHAVYDSTAAKASYDKDRKLDYMCNVIRVSFDPIRIGNEEDRVSRYVGGSYYRDPADENSGYIVLPCEYSLAELTKISDDILYQYDWVTFAGYVLN